MGKYPRGYLKYVDPPGPHNTHTCHPPMVPIRPGRITKKPEGGPGSIWLCECGKRWKVHSWGMSWVRRYWPWPR